MLKFIEKPKTHGVTRVLPKRAFRVPPIGLLLEGKIS
jgi:hypothetical protein